MRRTVTTSMYPTQTFENQGGAFDLRRLATLVFVATLVAGVAAGAVMLSPLSNTARGLTFHSSIVDRASMSTVVPGATATVTLRFRNAGLSSWERGGAGTQVDLGVKNDSVEFAQAGMAVGWLSDNRIATTSEQVVPPGAIGTFTFSVRAPDALGVYRIPVQLVADGVTWLDDQGIFVVIASDFGFHSELIDQSRHPTLRAGETSGPIVVKLRNTGSREWVRGKAEQQVNLGVEGGDASLKALAMGWPSADRVAIQTEPLVSPGDAATFAFRVRAPPTPGTYALRLRPVVDGVTWLEGDGVMTLITVTSASGRPAPQAGQTAATFASSASVAPLSVSAGEVASITAAFTSSAATTALVGIEVYTPDGAALAFQKWFETQSFAPGQSRSYPVTWQVPTTAAMGTYSVSLRAFAPDWKTQLSSKDAVATLAVTSPIATAPAATAAPAPAATLAVVTAGTTGGDGAPANVNANANANPNKKTLAPTAPPPPPSFTTAATATPTTVSPNDSVTVSASFTSAAATTVSLIVSIYGPGGVLPLLQQPFGSQVFGAGELRSYPLTWLAPSDASLGTYRVGLGVYSTDLVTEYLWIDSAATFAVAAPPPVATASVVPSPSFTHSTTVSPTSVTTGESVSITSTVTSATAATAIVSLYVFAPGGVTQLNQQYFENQIFTAGQQRTYTISWLVPATAATGTYVVKLGVFPPGWGTRYNWFDAAASFVVGAPVPTFTHSTTVSPTAVAAGESVSITSTVTSATAATAIVSLYVFAPGGVTQLNQQYFENQIFTAGQQRTYTISWLVPATAATGTYVVKLGVFPPGWGTRYNWFDSAAAFSVTGAAPAPAPTPVPTAVPAPTPVPPTSPSSLHVEGNKLVDGGRVVVLRGVDQYRFETSCVQGGGLFWGGLPRTQAGVDAIKSWGSNTVRLPLNEHCWLGVEGSPSGPTYQQGVADYVNLLTSSGVYVMVDLHWSAPAGVSANGQQAMPNTSYSRSFWTSVANRFKSNPRVLFDLFNEPIPNDNESDSTDTAARRQWECWRDGGASGSCNASMADGGNSTNISAGQTEGMQALLDAVRATGATNVVVLGGIQWANTLWSSSTRNILTYLPRDPLNQLMASLHVYPIYPTRCVDNACFLREVAPVAAVMPVVVGEIGGSTAEAGQLESEMDWFDAHGVGYLAWAWDLHDSKRLIVDVAGTPTAYGATFKNHFDALQP